MCVCVYVCIYVCMCLSVCCTPCSAVDGCGNEGDAHLDQHVLQSITPLPLPWAQRVVVLVLTSSSSASFSSSLFLSSAAAATVSCSTSSSPCWFIIHAPRRPTPRNGIQAHACAQLRVNLIDIEYVNCMWYHVNVADACVFVRYIHSLKHADIDGGSISERSRGEKKGSGCTHMHRNRRRGRGRGKVETSTSKCHLDIDKPDNYNCPLDTARRVNWVA
jgi:hypothetical protein